MKKESRDKCEKADATAPASVCLRVNVAAVGATGQVFKSCSEQRPKIRRKCINKK